MRDIKFRIWDKMGRKFLSLEDYQKLGAVHIENDGVISMSPDYRFSLSSMLQKNTFDVAQYTGLKDKNGKEIYEGDIISSIIDKKRPIEEAVIRDDMMGNPTIKNIKVGEQHLIGKAIYEIRWIDWGCKFEGVFIKYEPTGLTTTLGSGNLFLHPDSDNYKLEVEVIGNIHENPELLSN